MWAPYAPPSAVARGAGTGLSGGANAEEQLARNRLLGWQAEVNA